MSQANPTNTPPDPLFRLLSWVVTLCTLIALVLTAVRALLTPVFLPFEYNMPNFPADSYGFSKEDRLYWSGIALDYLVNEEKIDFLGNLRFADGAEVYNERELRHMVDVKKAVQAALTVWLISIGLLLLLGLWAWRGGWFDEFRYGMRRGGWLSVFFVVGVILVVLLSFGVFFVAFHNLFFESGTWTFNYSDTLIRLFPERFWRDIFIYVGVISTGLGLLVILLTQSTKRRT